MNRFFPVLLAAMAWSGLIADASAQATRGAPAGTTAQCADGSFSADPRRPCLGHKGVQSQAGAGSVPVQPQVAPAWPASPAPPTGARPQGSSIQGLPAGTSQLNSPTRR